MAKRGKPTRSRTARSAATSNQSPRTRSTGTGRSGSSGSAPTSETEVPTAAQDGTAPGTPKDDTPKSAVEASPETDAVTPDAPTPDTTESVSEADAPATGESPGDGSRPSQAAARADDDGMPPAPETEADATPDAAEENASATSGSADETAAGPRASDAAEPGTEKAAGTGLSEDDTVSPETGDFSVAPIEDGPSAQGETASPVPESTERADTVQGSRAAEAGAAAATATPAVREKVVERRGGFFAMLLGGVAAAAIGFGLSQYLGPNGWPFSDDGSLFEDETRSALDETRSGLEDTRTGLDDLGARIDGIETDLSEVDFGEMQQVVATLSGAVEEIRAEIAGLDAAITAMDDTAGTLADRVTAIEKAPMEDAVSPETVAAYERELDALQARVEEQNAANEQAAADRQAQMEEAFAGMQAEIEEQRAEIRAMVEEAQSAEQDAERQAQLATLRSAAGDLLTAVRTGDPYADALQPLSAAATVEVPEALSGPAEDGVPTQAELAQSYPDAARAALAAARSEAGGTGLQAFMARQLGARSVTPQEGDSPDAILSRAEAAVNGGDLQVALDEISALPQAAQDAMSDWVGQARTRAEAVAAADGLVQELNQQ